jgi:hypothetical protein
MWQNASYWEVETLIYFYNMVTIYVSVHTQYFSILITLFANRHF